VSGPGKDGVTGIWTVATISGEVRKIQDNVGQATLSPDGSRVVFERQKKLWEMGPNAEDPAPLPDVPTGFQLAAHWGFTNSWQLSWSHDGRWLTYVRRTSATDPPLLEARLPDNGPPITILKDADLRSYIWLSPTKVVLDRWEAPDKAFSNLWQIDVDSQSMKAIDAPQRLTNWAGFSLGTMSASRDGKLLALTRETDQSNIFVGELSDHGDSLRHLRRMSPGDRVEWPGAWSADSRALFLQSDRTGHMNIFRQRLGLTNAESVVMDQDDNRAPVLSSDKRWILYFAWPRSTPQTNTAKLMRKPLAGGTAELVLEAKGAPGSAQTSYRVIMPTMTGQPAFRCPSQRDSACVLAEAGQHEVVFYSFSPVPAATKSELFRIKADDPNTVAWDLSPDGSRVAYAEYDWHSTTVHIRDLGTNLVRDVPLKDAVELSTLAWSADGQSLFTTTFSLTGSSLLHVDLDGKYRLLYKGAKEVEGARPSPDGRYLAFGDVVSASNVWLVEGLPK
jgi:Tol biopolymer transport system component